MSKNKWRLSPKVKKKLDPIKSRYLPTDFRWEDYLSLNPDLANQGIVDEEGASDHYVLFGIPEFRSYKKTKKLDSNLIADVPEDFDWQAYLSLNPDIKKIIKNTEDKARLHYRKFGFFENRKYKLDAASSGSVTQKLSMSDGLPADFDYKVYRILNPDLSVIRSQKGLENHYIMHGNQENRRYACGLSYEQLVQLNNNSSKNIKLKPYVFFINHESSFTGAPLFLAKLANYFYDNKISQNIIFADCTPGIDYRLNPNIKVEYYFHDKEKLFELLNAYGPTYIYNNSLSPIAQDPLFFAKYIHKTIFHFHETCDNILDFCNLSNLKYIINNAYFSMFVAHGIIDQVNKTTSGSETEHSNMLLALKDWQQHNQDQNFMINDDYQITLSDDRHNKIKLFPPWIDLDTLNIPDKPAQLNDKITIGMCGKICDRKHPELFKYLAKHNPEYNFIWVGGEDKDNKLKNLTYIAETQDPFFYFQSFDYFFLSSKHDPCPISVLENLYINNKIILLDGNIEYNHEINKLENVTYLPNHNNDIIKINNDFSKLKLSKLRNKTDKNKEYIKENFSKPKVSNVNTYAPYHLLFSYYDNPNSDIDYYVDIINQKVALNPDLANVIFAVAADSKELAIKTKKYLEDHIKYDNLNIIIRNNIGWDIGGLIDMLHFCHIPEEEHIIYLHNKTNPIWRESLFRILYTKNIHTHDTFIPKDCFMKCSHGDKNRTIMQRHKFMHDAAHTDFSFSTGTCFISRASNLKTIKSNYEYIVSQLTTIDTDDTYWQSIMKDKEVFDFYYKLMLNSNIASNIDKDARDIMIKNNSKNYFDLQKKHNRRGIPDCMFEHALERFIGYLITFNQRVSLL